MSPAHPLFDLQITFSGDEPFLRLCLRLPNGAKETISICATDTIEVRIQVSF